MRPYAQALELDVRNVVTDPKSPGNLRALEMFAGMAQTIPVATWEWDFHIQRPTTSLKLTMTTGIASRFTNLM